MINVEQIEKDIINREKEIPENNHSMAYMLLIELKASARRWFIIALAELVIIVLIVAGMIWYNSLPVEEYTATVETDGNANTAVGIGDISNGYTNKGISENTAW